MLTLMLAAALAQQAASFTIALSARPAEVTPLFGPVREAEWARGWSPRFLHPPGGAQRDGVVFTTEAPGGREQLWLLTDYDVDAGRVAYVCVTPGYLAREIRIHVVADGPSRSRATITYRLSALVEQANEDVRAIDARWAAAQTAHWEAAINAAIQKTGAGR